MSHTIDDNRIRSLATAARALGRSVQLDTMVEIAAEQALAAIGAASVSISRLEQGTGTLRTLINVGALGPDEVRWPKHEIYRLEDFLQLQKVVGELRIWTITLDDPEADPNEVDLLASLGKGAAMAAPLIVDGKLWGELYSTRRVNDPAFDDGDVAYTEALSAILAGAVSRALHVDSLERLAYFDPLTGLANRRALDEAAANAFDSIADRAGRRISIIAIDLNGLKSVNDRYGHSEGDRLLTSVGHLLQRNFAPLHGSLVARVGGDEFIVLVPGHDVEKVHVAASMLCHDATRLPYGSGLSCGIATTSHEADRVTALQLFQAADMAQYRAKRENMRQPAIAEL